MNAILKTAMGIPMKNWCHTINDEKKPLYKKESYFSWDVTGYQCHWSAPSWTTTFACISYDVISTQFFVGSIKNERKMWLPSTYPGNTATTILFTTIFKHLISVGFQYLILDNWNPTETPLEKRYIQLLKNPTFYTEIQPFWNVF